MLPSWDFGKLLYDSNSCLWRIFNIKVPEWLFPDGRTCDVFHIIDSGGHVCLYIRMEMFCNSHTTTILWRITEKLQITNVFFFSKGTMCISEEQHNNEIFYFAFKFLFNRRKSSWTLTLDFTSSSRKHELNVPAAVWEQITWNKSDLNLTAVYKTDQKSGGVTLAPQKLFSLESDHFSRVR